jgi:hypothetical protein
MAKQYPNRSDLRNAGGKVAKKVATGQTYGEATKQMDAQSAVPMAAAPTDAPPQIMPGQLGAFNRPTERPDEPLTAGASFGAGPTPRTQFAVPTSDPVLTELRALYSAYPSTELADMLDSYVREGY